MIALHPWNRKTAPGDGSTGDGTAEQGPTNNTHIIAARKEEVKP